MELTLRNISYEVSDDRLIAYGRLPILDRLRWLDEVRRFTLMMRQAPTIPAGRHRDGMTGEPIAVFRGT